MQQCTFLLTGLLSLTSIRGTMFAPTWSSLRRHTIPEWFRDAKFGIWAHWGAQSVARSGDWYARHLYGVHPGSESWEHRRATSQRDFHRATFGHPGTVGYKDLLPHWRAEAFDADRLIELFVASGARYFMSMGVHCDNVDLWDSRHHGWNTTRIGPRRNIVGEWERAARAAGLPFGLSFHNNWTWRWLDSAHASDPDTSEPYDGGQRAADGQGLWWEGLDPRDLYLDPHPPGAPPPDHVVTNFYRRVRDAVQQHRPDLIYFDDSRLPFDDGSILPADPVSHQGLEFVADYYNWSRNWSPDGNEGLVSIKNVPDEDRHAIMLDSERHQLDALQDVAWQFDSSDGEWFDCQRLEDFFHPRKTARQIVHTLADVVSKNGTLLLNIPQRADGTIDDHSEKLLTGVGDWLRTCGEAIFGTRPWRVFGEGDTALDPTQLYNESDLPFTAADIRFTRDGDTIFAILLAWPTDGRARITNLATHPVGQVDLLGHPQPLTWRRSPGSLEVDLPREPATPYAHVLRIRS